MKQIVTQIIVLVLLIGVFGFFVYIFRAGRSARAAGRKALADLAREIGASDAPSTKPGLHGSLGGRRCSLHQTRRPGSDDQQPYVHLAIACAAPATFQMHRSQPSMAGIDAPDLVRSGDEEFDLQIMVRSNDPDRARAILRPELRARLLDWFKRGKIENVWTKESELLIDGGYGLEAGWEVELARELLHTGVAIADGLERQ